MILDLVVISLDMTPKAEDTKEKIDELDCTEINKSCAPKNSINRVKRRSLEWEKIFASHTTGKGFLSRVYKLLQLNNSNKNQFLKWAKDMNRYFFKEDVQMTKKHMKRCSITLIISEMQINAKPQ